MITLKRIFTIVTFFVVCTAMGQTAEEYLKKGNNKINKGAFSDAIPLYTKAIELKSDFKEAYKNRGISYSLTNQYDKAIADYNKAISLSSKDYSLYSYRGMAVFEQAKGDADKMKLALPDLNKALELNPDFVEGYLNLSKVYTTLNNHEEAIMQATKAIAKNPDYGKAYYDRGIAHHNNKSIAMACLDWKRAKGKGFEYADNALTSFCE